MLIVSQLVKRDDCADELRQLTLWNMRTDAVRRVHLSVFFQLGKRLTDHHIAQNCANYILERLKSAHLNRVIRNPHLMGCEGIVTPFFSFELKRGLQSMDMMSRRCVYFALLSDLPITQVVKLTWHKVKDLKRRQFAHLDAAWDVLDGTPHHIHSPLVFWHHDGDEVQGLEFIEEDVQLAFGVTFSELRMKFADMVLLDQSHDAEQLIQKWS